MPSAASMSDHAFALVELLGVFALAIGWGVWEIRVTNRARRESERKARSADKSRPLA